MIISKKNIKDETNDIDNTDDRTNVYFSMVNKLFVLGKFFLLI